LLRNIKFRQERELWNRTITQTLKKYENHCLTERNTNRIAKCCKELFHASGPLSGIAGDDLEIASGQFVALVGRSGSGKSTLLNLIGGIDRPSQGELMVAGAAVHQVPESALARWRGKTVGLCSSSFSCCPP